MTRTPKPHAYEVATKLLKYTPVQCASEETRPYFAACMTLGGKPIGPIDTTTTTTTTTTPYYSYCYYDCRYPRTR
jgi:hypothetical protein